MKEALYYRKNTKEGDNSVSCLLCPHECSIKDGKVGICSVRKNESGVLIPLTYGRPSSIQLDPIEKKPLYHFLPGSKILSIGTSGCNFSCGFCQNWSLVKSDIPHSFLPPEDLPTLAQKHSSIGIAYTYNEPLIWYEYILDAGKAVKEAGLRNVLVTNGFINPEPLDQILPLIDAINIDLKSIDPSFYKKICKGELEPVKETIRRSHDSCLIEVTNLIIPNENDSEDQIKRLVEFIAGIDQNIPLHFSRYFPHRGFSSPPTSPDKLLRAYEIAKTMIHYVYLGNMAADVGQNSLCPHCNALVIERQGYFVKIKKLEGATCGNCGSKLNFIV